MKKLSLFIHAIIIVLLASSCEESGPYINFTPERSVSDTTYITTTIPAAQPTNVLIEDFTGVKCPNCPKAQQTAKTLAENNLNRVFVMAVHPKGYLNSLTRPFAQPGDDHTSNYDFNTVEGGQIFDFLGVSQSLPKGAINRTQFGSETAILVDEGKWSNYTNTKLLNTSTVNIDTFGTKGVYFSSANTIRFNIKLTYTDNVTDSQYISIAIIEDGLLDYQEKSNPSTGLTDIIENYQHNHILRRMVTASTGEKLNAPCVKGRVFEKAYEYELKATDTWNRDNISAIVFVHNGSSSNTATSKNIIQVKEYKIR